jgi:tetratricopeptide (TPR) repeat protein
VSNWRKAVIDCQYIPDEGLCLYILHLAGKHNDPKLAGDVIRTIGELGYTYRECHFAPLIDAFASTGDIANTFKVFSSMRKIGIIPDKKSALPVAYKIGRDINAIHKAKDALQDISDRGELVDVTAFNLVIHAFAFNKKYDEAISQYGQAKRLGVTPNSETLDATLDACIHCKDAELGKSIYQECISRGIKASVTSLSKMVTLMCTQEDYEDAFTYLERMKKLKMIPLRGCYFKLVKTLSRANDPRLETALEDMRAYGYDSSTHMNEFMEKEDEKRDLINLV